MLPDVLPDTVATRALPRRHTPDNTVDRRRRILILGYTEVGRALEMRLRSDSAYKCEVIGFIDDGHNDDILGPVKDVVSIARRHFIDELLVATSPTSPLVSTAIEEARRDHISVVLMSEFAGVFGLEHNGDSIGGFPIVIIGREQSHHMRCFLKRCLDILGASVGLVVLFPLFLFIAVLVKLGSSGPIFYAHTRVGRKGANFTCYKFRTMTPNANAEKHTLRHLNELGDGFFFKIRKDPRVTPVGSILRRYSLDELPQLFNVLLGDMSLVGPRPSPTDEFNMYDTPHFRRLDVKPGITGLWQIVGRRDPDFNRAMLVDREYVDRWNLWLDLAILIKTVPVLTQGE